MLENTLSATQFDARVWGQGSLDFIMTPAVNGGNYFAGLSIEDCVERSQREVARLFGGAAS